MSESGLAGYESSLWQAIVIPASTPTAIGAQFNREATAVLNNPDVKAVLAKQGIEVESRPPEALAARIRDDIKKWSDVITSTGITVK